MVNETCEERYWGKVSVSESSLFLGLTKTQTVQLLQVGVCGSRVGTTKNTDIELGSLTFFFFREPIELCQRNL